MTATHTPTETATPPNPTPTRWSPLLPDPFNENVNKWHPGDMSNDRVTGGRSFVNGKYRWDVVAKQSFVATDYPWSYAGYAGANFGHRGRTASYPTAPAQIPACGFPAPGSSGILASAFQPRPSKLPFSSLVVLRSVVVLC
jgi:hypothetical protein